MKNMKKRKVLKSSTVVLRPLRTRHGEFYDYGVASDGRVISFKGSAPIVLTANSSGNTTYPKVSLCEFGSKIQINVHEASFWTHNPTAVKPESVLDDEWKKSTKYMQDLAKLGFEVHHIDDDPTNFHPDNLVLVTSAENKQYQRQRESLKQK